MKIYLASPLGFSEVTHSFMEELVSKLKDEGYKVLNPWDYFDNAEIEKIEEINDHDKKRNKFHDLNMKIGKKNKELIDKCDIVFAVLDGPDVDSGVASEIYELCEGANCMALAEEYCDKRIDL